MCRYRALQSVELVLAKQNSANSPQSKQGVPHLRGRHTRPTPNVPHRFLRHAENKQAARRRRPIWSKSYAWHPLAQGGKRPCVDPVAATALRPLRPAPANSAVLESGHCASGCKAKPDCLGRRQRLRRGHMAQHPGAIVRKEVTAPP